MERIVVLLALDLVVLEVFGDLMVFFDIQGSVQAFLGFLVPVALLILLAEQGNVLVRPGFVHTDHVGCYDGHWSDISVCIYQGPLSTLAS